MINISKLWGQSGFTNLTNNAKLFYIYLATNPNISRVGVCCISPQIMCSTLSIDIEELRNITKELKNQKLIYVIGDKGDSYFIVPSHFSTVSKSLSSLEKIKSDLKSLPDIVVVFLESIGISVKNSNMLIPSEEEVNDFILSQGYDIDAKTFIDYYNNQTELNGYKDKNVWMDSNGRVIKDWKSKLQRVWFKKDRKVDIPSDSPKGYELFHVVVNNKKHFPTEWKNGKPKHKDFIIEKELNKKYKKSINND